MDKHYQFFKQNLSWIEIDFKKLLETQSFITTNPSEKKTVNAKKVAIMMEKYLDQSPNMLYEILTRNIGRTNITWDDLLKCLQDEFNLSYTVLKRQSKSFSISEARWSPTTQYKRIHQYLKLKQTNYIQNIIKPSLGFNISQVSSQSDFLAVLLEKQLLFYLIQEDRIVSVMDFKYRNVKQKLLKKYHQIENQKNQARKNNQSIDYMPLKNHNKAKQQNKRSKSKINQSKYQISIRESNRLAQSEDITQSAQSKNRSRLNSNASSDLSAFIKRYQTDNGTSDWRRKSLSKRQNSVKIRTNTTRKVFQLFENAKLQNSIEIAKKFQQSRDSFQQFVILDKKLLQKQPESELEEVAMQRNTFDFKSELQKMKLTAKLMPKYKKSCSFFGSNNDKQNNNYELYFKSLEKNKSRQNNMQSKSKGFEKFKSQSMNKSLKYTHNEPSNCMDPLSNDMNESNKLLEDNKIGVVSYSFYENLLLVSLYNRQVRLYRIKKNLHKIKQQLVFQKHNDSLVTYAQLYKATFAQTYNMILCSNKNNEAPVIKIFEISNEKISSLVIQQDQKVGSQNYGSMDKSLTNNNFMGKDFKQIFSCKLSFDPIYQNLLPLGIGAFNERGFLALIEINNISVDCQNKSQKKIFEKDFFNTITGQMISFVACKVHSNMINMYLVCKSGFIYFVDKLTGKIKLLRKLSQYKIFDLQLIKESTQILVVSQKGELMIVNSQNLEPMYFLQMYMSLSEDSRLLKLAENKFIFYDARALRVIEITQNEEKLLEYQKPLKIYRNRIKIKKQQALLSKQAHEIQGRKQKLQTGKNSLEIHCNTLFDQEPIHSKARGHSMGIQEVVRESKMEKFQSKLNKRKIQQFYEMTTVSNPHYVMVLQNGQILVYSSKGQYYGQYLKNRGLETTMCILNKKLHYLAILYSNNTADIVNLYSQVSVLKLPLQKNDQQELGILKSAKNMAFNQSGSIIGQHNQSEEIIMVGFVEISSSANNSNINRPQSNNLSYELIYVLDRSFILNLLTFKGVATKTVHLKNFSFNNINLIQSRTIASCTYWDKTGELIIGNDKGQLLFYQKNTLQYHKTLKISPFPIVKLQPLTHNKKQKQKQNYLLCLLENNQLFLIHKYTGMVKRIYSPQGDIQKERVIRFQKQSYSKVGQQNKRPNTRDKNKQRPSSIQSKQRHRYTLINSRQTYIMKDQINNFEIDREGKVSSIHYFSKMVSFSEFFAVYEWEEIYEKQILVHEKINNDFQLNNGSQTISLKKTMESIIKVNNNKNDKKLTSKEEIRQYKTKGYLIEKIPKISEIQEINKRMTKSEQAADPFNTQSNKQFLSIFTNPNCFFLKVYSTEDQFLFSHQSHHSLTSQTFNKPYEIHCFTDTTKLTVIIEPQSQFRNINFNSKLNTKNNTNKESLMNSSLNSRKSSFDCTNINNLSMSLNFHKSMPKKSIIKVYDLDQLIKSNNNFNTLNDQSSFKVLLEQQI